MRQRPSRPARRSMSLSPAASLCSRPGSKRSLIVKFRRRRLAAVGHRDLESDAGRRRSPAAGPVMRMSIVDAAGAAALRPSVTVVVAQSLTFSPPAAVASQQFVTLPGSLGAETDLDRPPLPSAKFAQPPLKLLAGHLGGRIAAEVRQPVRHHVGHHNVLGRQIARIGDINPVAERSADIGHGRTDRLDRPGRRRSTSSSSCRCRRPAAGRPRRAVRPAGSPGCRPCSCRAPAASGRSRRRPGRRSWWALRPPGRRRAKSRPAARR